MLGAQALALVSLLLFGGVWADRLERHRVMISTDVVRATLHALVAILILTGTIRIWELVVIEFLFGAAMAFYQPAYSGLLPQTVPEAEIQAARGTEPDIRNVAFLLGPALATVLVLGVGAGEAFAIDAATFAVSAVLLLRVRPRARGAARADRVGNRGPARRMARGAVARVGVGDDRRVRRAAAVRVRAVVRAGAEHRPRRLWQRRGLRHPRGDGRRGRGHRRRPLRALAPGPPAAHRVDRAAELADRHRPRRLRRARGAGAAAIFVAGWSFGVFVVFWESALAHHIPPHLLSRVSAWDWMGSLALVPVGYLIAGPLAEMVGARVVLGAAARSVSDCWRRH